MAPLTPSEDAWLRRLHFVEQLGARLSAQVSSSKVQLQLRDQRGTVREPLESNVLQPA